MASEKQHSQTANMAYEQAEPPRPHKTSMEGMIWNSHFALEQLLNAGIPHGFFQDCAAICILSLVEAGLVFKGSVGTGILLSHKNSGGDNNDSNRETKWSNPVACHVSGVGFGLVVGFGSRDIIIFLRDDDVLHTFLSDGIRLNAQTNLMIGERKGVSGAPNSEDWKSPTASVALNNKGVLLDVSLDGAVIQPRIKVNNGFYGGKPGESNVEPIDIINGKVDFPHHRITLYDEILEQLEQLSEGKTMEEAERDSNGRKSKVDEARVVADKAAEYVNEDNEAVIVVDAKAGSTKEDGSLGTADPYQSLQKRQT